MPRDRAIFNWGLNANAPSNEGQSIVLAQVELDDKATGMFHVVLNSQPALATFEQSFYCKIEFGQGGARDVVYLDFKTGQGIDIPASVIQVFAVSESGPIATPFPVGAMVTRSDGGSANGLPPTLTQKVIVGAGATAIVNWASRIPELANATIPLMYMPPYMQAIWVYPGGLFSTAAYEVYFRDAANLIVGGGIYGTAVVQSPIVSRIPIPWNATAIFIDNLSAVAGTFYVMGEIGL